MKSRGGIIVPDSAKEKLQEGEVVAARAGSSDENSTLIRLHIKTGDFILFGKWSGAAVRIDAENLLFMKEAEIMVQRTA